MSKIKDFEKYSIEDIRIKIKFTIPKIPINIMKIDITRIPIQKELIIYCKILYNKHEIVVRLTKIPLVLIMLIFK